MGDRLVAARERVDGPIRPVRLVGSVGSRLDDQVAVADWVVVDSELQDTVEHQPSAARGRRR